jgi:RNA polymerase sigma-70 factor (ECF subfamily)
VHADAEALFRAHYTALTRYATRLSGDVELARDAVQEAFLRLVERQPRSTALRAWLYTVTTSVVLERRRTSARRTRLLAVAGAPQPSSPEDPDVVVERRERVARVRAALDTLPPRDRAALLLREEGFSHREIASSIGTTTGSVGTVIARALERLAAVLSLDAVEG